jgi:hypothetical protein
VAQETRGLYWFRPSGSYVQFGMVFFTPKACSRGYKLGRERVAVPKSLDVGSRVCVHVCSRVHECLSLCTHSQSSSTCFDAPLL